MPHYFDNEKVEEMILKYKKMKEKIGDQYPEPEEFKKLKNEIFTEIAKIINGIIFTHRFTVWAPFDDLFQEAMLACTTAIDKFNPNFITSKGKKATAFNYFSLTAKNALKFYTMRNKKHRDNFQIDDYQQSLLYYPYNNINLKIIKEQVINRLYTLFSKTKYKKLLPLVELLDQYLYTFREFNKRDFTKYVKSFGYSPTLIKKFFAIIKANSKNLNA